MATTDRKMTENLVMQRILGLLRDKEKLDKDLTDYLGIAPTAMTKWKYDGSNAFLRYIEPIREYLDTTPNYLFWGAKGYTPEDGLTSAEFELIRKYRKLDTKRKKCVKEVIEYISHNIESDQS